MVDEGAGEALKTLGVSVRTVESGMVGIVGRIALMTDEPSLSADTRSMLHDEHSKRLEIVERDLLSAQLILQGVLERVLAIEDICRHPKSGLIAPSGGLYFAGKTAQAAYRVAVDPEPLPWEELD